MSSGQRPVKQKVIRLVPEEEEGLLVDILTQKDPLRIPALHLIEKREGDVIGTAHWMSLRRQGYLPSIVRQRMVKKMSLGFLG